MTVQETLFERTQEESVLTRYKTKFGAFLKATFKRKDLEKTPEQRIQEALTTVHQLIQENQVEQAKNVYKDMINYYNSLTDEKMKQQLYNAVFDVYSVLATK